MMKLPSLDCPLADPGLVWIRVGQWAGILLLAASLCAAVWLQSESRFLEAQAKQYELAAARQQESNRKVVQEAQRAGLDLSEARRKTLGRDVAFAKQILEQHAFSWTRFLSDLESTVPAQVSLVSVSLNFKAAAITLNGSALALRDLTGFVNELERHPAFQNVVLAQHRQQGGQGQGPQQPQQVVDFTLTVTYQPKTER